MKNILCTLVLMFLGQGAFLSPFGFSDLSEGQETVLLSEESEEIVAGSVVEFIASLQKDLHKTKILLKADFNSFCGTLMTTESFLLKSPEIIPNLSTAKIIYPFHSFP